MTRHNLPSSPPYYFLINLPLRAIMCVQIVRPSQGPVAMLRSVIEPQCPVCLYVIHVATVLVWWQSTGYIRLWGLILFWEWASHSVCVFCFFLLLADWKRIMLWLLSVFSVSMSRELTPYPLLFLYSSQSPKLSSLLLSDQFTIESNNVCSNC